MSDNIDNGLQDANLPLNPSGRNRYASDSIVQFAAKFNENNKIILTKNDPLAGGDSFTGLEWDPQNRSLTLQLPEGEIFIGSPEGIDTKSLEQAIEDSSSIGKTIRFVEDINTLRDIPVEGNGPIYPGCIVGDSNNIVPGSQAFFYQWNANSTRNHNPPNVVRPNELDQATSGRWEITTSIPLDLHQILLHNENPEEVAQRPQPQTELQVFVSQGGTTTNIADDHPPGIYQWDSSDTLNAPGHIRPNSQVGAMTGRWVRQTGGFNDPLLKQNNLSDLNDAEEARTNLNLGSAALENADVFLSDSNNLSDLDDEEEARTNLGLGSIAVEDADGFLTVANNLSDLNNVDTARQNLGMPAVNNVLSDPAAFYRESHFLVRGNNLSDLLDVQDARTNLDLGSAAQENSIAFLNNDNTNFLGEISDGNLYSETEINAHQNQARGNLGMPGTDGDAALETSDAFLANDPINFLSEINSGGDSNQVRAQQEQARGNLGMPGTSTDVARLQIDNVLQNSTAEGQLFEISIDQSGNNNPDNVLIQQQAARANLGMPGTETDAATFQASAFLKVNRNLEEVNNATARSNLGLGTAAEDNSEDFLQNNPSNYFIEVATDAQGVNDPNNVRIQQEGARNNLGMPGTDTDAALYSRDYFIRKDFDSVTTGNYSFSGDITTTGDISITQGPSMGISYVDGSSSASFGIVGGIAGLTLSDIDTFNIQNTTEDGVIILTSDFLRLAGVLDAPLQSESSIELYHTSDNLNEDSITIDVDSTKGEIKHIGEGVNEKYLTISNEESGGDGQDSLEIGLDWDNVGSRIRFNGNKVWHGGNQGEGSGLDADMLDGEGKDFYVDVKNFYAKKPQGYRIHVSQSTGDDSQFGFAPEQAVRTIKEAATVAFSLQAPNTYEGNLRRDAVKALSKNRTIIVEEIFQRLRTNPIGNEIPPSLFVNCGNDARSPRDIGLIYDALVRDILLGGNQEIIRAFNKLFDAFNTLDNTVDNRNRRIGIMEIWDGLDDQENLNEGIMGNLVRLMRDCISADLMPSSFTATTVSNSEIYEGHNTGNSGECQFIVDHLSDLRDLLRQNNTNGCNARIETDVIAPQRPLGGWLNEVSVVSPNQGNRKPFSTIIIESGTYEEELPIALPDGVTILGDSLRRTTIVPTPKIRKMGCGLHQAIKQSTFRGLELDPLKDSRQWHIDLYVEVGSSQAIVNAVYEDLTLESITTITQDFVQTPAEGIVKEIESLGSLQNSTVPDAVLMRFRVVTPDSDQPFFPNILGFNNSNNSNGIRIRKSDGTEILNPEFGYLRRIDFFNGYLLLKDENNDAITIEDNTNYERGDSITPSTTLSAMPDVLKQKNNKIETGLRKGDVLLLLDPVARRQELVRVDDTKDDGNNIQIRFIPHICNGAVNPSRCMVYMAPRTYWQSSCIKNLPENGFSENSNSFASFIVQTNTAEVGQYAFTVGNANYVTQVNFKETTNYSFAFRSDVPRVYASPYIQNCSSLSTFGGGGILVDGKRPTQPDNDLPVKVDSETWALAENNSVPESLPTLGSSLYDKNIDASNLINTHKELIIDNTIARLTGQWVNNFEEKCRRDMMFIVESIAWQLVRGGNDRVYDYTLIINEAITKQAESDPDLDLATIRNRYRIILDGEDENDVGPLRDELIKAIEGNGYDSGSVRGGDCSDVISGVEVMLDIYSRIIGLGENPNNVTTRVSNLGEPWYVLNRGQNAELRSFVLDAFTQINTFGGQGHLIRQNGYAQLVSTFTTFCDLGIKVESGGLVNLSNSVTDFGWIGLVADGLSEFPYLEAKVAREVIGVDSNNVPTREIYLKSEITEPIGGYLGNNLVFSQRQDTLIGLTGDEASQSLVKAIQLNSTMFFYASSGVYDFDGNGNHLSPNEQVPRFIEVSDWEGDQKSSLSYQRIEDGNGNLVPTVRVIVPVDQRIPGKDVTGEVSSATLEEDTIVRFFITSTVTSSSHGFEYEGSGDDYTNALPENGGIPDPTKKALSTGGGQVFVSSTDVKGNFEVGSFFKVEQSTGAVTFNPETLELTNLTKIGPFRTNGLTGNNVISDLSNDFRRLLDIENVPKTAPDNETIVTVSAIKQSINTRITSLVERVEDTLTQATNNNKVLEALRNPINDLGAWALRHSVYHRELKLRDNQNFILTSTNLSDSQTESFNAEFGGNAEAFSSEVLNEFRSRASYTLNVVLDTSESMSQSGFYSQVKSDLLSLFYGFDQNDSISIYKSSGTKLNTRHVILDANIIDFNSGGPLDSSNFPIDVTSITYPTNIENNTFVIKDNPNTNSTPRGKVVAAYPNELKVAIELLDNGFSSGKLFVGCDIEVSGATFRVAAVEPGNISSIFSISDSPTIVVENPSEDYTEEIRNGLLREVGVVVPTNEQVYNRNLLEARVAWLRESDINDFWEGFDIYPANWLHSQWGGTLADFLPDDVDEGVINWTDQANQPSDTPDFGFILDSAVTEDLSQNGPKYLPPRTSLTTYPAQDDNGISLGGDYISEGESIRRFLPKYNTNNDNSPQDPEGFLTYNDFDPDNDKNFLKEIPSKPQIDICFVFEDRWRTRRTFSLLAENFRNLFANLSEQGTLDWRIGKLRYRSSTSWYNIKDIDPDNQSYASVSSYWPIRRDFDRHILAIESQHRFLNNSPTFAKSMRPTIDQYVIDINDYLDTLSNPATKQNLQDNLNADIYNILDPIYDEELDGLTLQEQKDFNYLRLLQSELGEIDSSTISGNNRDVIGDSEFYFRPGTRMLMPLRAGAPIYLTQGYDSGWSNDTIFPLGDYTANPTFEFKWPYSSTPVAFADGDTLGISIYGGSKYNDTFIYFRITLRVVGDHPSGSSTITMESQDIRSQFENYCEGEGHTPVSIDVDGSFSVNDPDSNAQIVDGIYSHGDPHPFYSDVTVLRQDKNGNDTGNENFGIRIDGNTSRQDDKLELEVVEDFIPSELVNVNWPSNYIDSGGRANDEGYIKVKPKDGSQFDSAVSGEDKVLGDFPGENIDTYFDPDKSLCMYGTSVNGRNYHPTYHAVSTACREMKWRPGSTRVIIHLEVYNDQVTYSYGSLTYGENYSGSANYDSSNNADMRAMRRHDDLILQFYRYKKRIEDDGETPGERESRFPTEELELLYYLALENKRFDEVSENPDLSIQELPDGSLTKNYLEGKVLENGNLNSDVESDISFLAEELITHQIDQFHSITDSNTYFKSKNTGGEDSGRFNITETIRPFHRNTVMTNFSESVVRKVLRARAGFEELSDWWEEENDYLENGDNLDFDVFPSGRWLNFWDLYHRRNTTMVSDLITDFNLVIGEGTGTLYSDITTTDPASTLMATNPPLYENKIEIGIVPTDGNTDDVEFNLTKKWPTPSILPTPSIGPRGVLGNSTVANEFTEVPGITLEGKSAIYESIISAKKDLTPGNTLSQLDLDPRTNSKFYGRNPARDGTINITAVLSDGLDNDSFEDQIIPYNYVDRSSPSEELKRLFQAIFMVSGTGRIHYSNPNFVQQKHIYTTEVLNLIRAVAWSQTGGDSTELNLSGAVINFYKLTEDDSGLTNLFPFENDSTEFNKAKRILGSSVINVKDKMKSFVPVYRGSGDVNHFVIQADSVERASSTSSLSPKNYFPNPYTFVPIAIPVNKSPGNRDIEGSNIFTFLGEEGPDITITFDLRTLNIDQDYNFTGDFVTPPTTTVTLYSKLGYLHKNLRDTGSDKASDSLVVLDPGYDQKTSFNNQVLAQNLDGRGSGTLFKFPESILQNSLDDNIADRNDNDVPNYRKYPVKPIFEQRLDYLNGFTSAGRKKYLVAGSPLVSRRYVGTQTSGEYIASPFVSQIGGIGDPNDPGVWTLFVTRADLNGNERNVVYNTTSTNLDLNWEEKIGLKLRTGGTNLRISSLSNEVVDLVIGESTTYSTPAVVLEDRESNNSKVMALADNLEDWISIADKEKGEINLERTEGDYLHQILQVNDVGTNDDNILVLLKRDDLSNQSEIYVRKNDFSNNWVRIARTYSVLETDNSLKNFTFGSLDYERFSVEEVDDGDGDPGVYYWDPTYDWNGTADNIQSDINNGTVIPGGSVLNLDGLEDEEGNAFTFDANREVEGDVDEVFITVIGDEIETNNGVWRYPNPNDTGTIFGKFDFFNLGAWVKDTAYEGSLTLDGNSDQKLYEQLSLDNTSLIRISSWNYGGADGPNYLVALGKSSYSSKTQVFVCNLDQRYDHFVNETANNGAWNVIGKEHPRTVDSGSLDPNNGFDTLIANVNGDDEIEPIENNCETVGVILINNEVLVGFGDDRYAESSDGIVGNKILSYKDSDDDGVFAWENITPGVYTPLDESVDPTIEHGPIILLFKIGKDDTSTDYDYGFFTRGGSFLYLFIHSSSGNWKRLSMQITGNSSERKYTPPVVYKDDLILCIGSTEDPEENVILNIPLSDIDAASNGDDLIAISNDITNNIRFRPLEDPSVYPRFPHSDNWIRDVMIGVNRGEITATSPKDQNNFSWNAPRYQGNNLFGTLESETNPYRRSLI